MNILGLVFNMVGVVILAFQPYETLWGTGIRPKIMWVNILGWAFMFAGFTLMLFNELRKKNKS